VSSTIIDGNRKVVTSTEIAVSFIDHSPLLPLKFLIWSLRGVVAGELRCFYSQSFGCA
jgi:hypothetical protein